MWKPQILRKTLLPPTMFILGEVSIQKDLNMMNYQITITLLEKKTFLKFEQKIFRLLMDFVSKNLAD
jgi:hypothetical protein